MKTMNHKNLLSTGISIAMALAAWMPTTPGFAEEPKAMKPMKGGEHMLMLNKIETKAEADALKSDDTVAMVCAKCKTVFVSRAVHGIKGAQLLKEGFRHTEIIGTHGCAGCKSTLNVVGHAKGDITELKHSCGVCGDDSAFCCATKTGSNHTKHTEK